MMTIDLSRRCLKPILSRSLFVGFFSVLGVLTGMAPHFSVASPQLVLSNAAYAQAVSNEEVTSYALSILAIEPLRQEAYEEVKNLLGSVPPINCSSAGNVNQLPTEIRGIAVNYCEQSKNLVASHSLSINRFNEITAALQADTELEKRIRAELKRLQ